MVSKDEIWRIVDYCKLCSRSDIFPVTSLAHRRPCGNGDGGGPSAGTSLALQALYANDALSLT